MMKIAVLLFFVLSGMVCFSGSARAVKSDRAVMVEDKDTFEDAQKERAQTSAKKAPTKKTIKMDFSEMWVPESPDAFQKVWFNPPISQDLTGTCWAFASTSFFESEIYRLKGKKVKLSEMYTVYWEYIEKAQKFVEERGESAFGRGSQPNATIRVWKRYGIVPAEAYLPKPTPELMYDHTKLYPEMKAYLDSVRQNNAWDETAVMSTIRSMLNHYMGVPPTSITLDGNELTPKEYLNDALGLNMDDYANVMSLMEKPFEENQEYEVYDNWFHSRDYHNVPLETFMKIIERGVRDGFSVCIAGDVSETGLWMPINAAVVPTYDIPSERIDDAARQLRFGDDRTTDDHVIHIVGFLEKDGKDWFLMKDSGSMARNGKHDGYMFFHEDYVKLKLMNFMVHRDVVKKVLEEGK